MAETDDHAPLYFIEPSHEKPGTWRVAGPNGIVGEYGAAAEAQAKADLLNEQIAEETENDF